MWLPTESTAPAQRGAAIVLETAQLPNDLLPTVQSLSRDPERLQQMRQAMQALARPQAAERLADLALQLAESGGQQQRTQLRTNKTGSRER